MSKEKLQVYNSNNGNGGHLSTMSPMSIKDRFGWHNKQKKQQSWEVLIRSFKVISWRQCHLQWLLTQRQPRVAKDEWSVRELNTQEEKKNCWEVVLLWHLSKKRALNGLTSICNKRMNLPFRKCVFFLLFHSFCLFLPVCLFFWRSHWLEK